MRLKIGEGPWRTTPSQIIRCRKNPDRCVLKFVRDQPRIARHTEPDRQIEALFDEIDVAVRQAEFELDLRVPLGEARQQGHQAKIGVERPDADAQHTARHFLVTGNGALGFGDLLKRALALLPIQLALAGQPDLTGRARKQTHAEPRFQTTDRAADRGWRQTEELGRRRKAAEFGRLAELFDAVELNRVEGPHDLFTRVINKVICDAFIR